MVRKAELEAPPGSLDLSLFRSWSPEVGWYHNKGFNLEKKHRERFSKLPSPK